MFNLEIVKSNRRSISIIIENNLTVKVRAPIFLSNHKINTFIEEKQSWIIKSIEKMKSNNNFISKREFIDNELFLYKGQEVRLLFLEEEFSGSKFHNQCIYISRKNQSNSKKIIISFYKKMAKELLSERIQYYSDKHGFEFNNLKLSSAKTNWGSCSSKKNINLNYKLIMAPIEVIDYVIIHELCHLKEHNHSSRFWNLVGSIDKNYKEHKKWLSDNGNRLIIE